MARSAASKAKKKKYDLEFQKRPEQVRKRVEANRANRKAQKNGTAKKGDGKDWDHKTKRMVSEKTNRGRRGEGNRKSGKRK